MRDETIFQRAGDAINLAPRVVLQKLQTSARFSGVHYLSPCILNCPQVKMKMVRANQLYPVLPDCVIGWSVGTKVLRTEAEFNSIMTLCNSVLLLVVLTFRLLPETCINNKKTSMV